MKPKKIAVLVNMDARQGIAGIVWEKIKSQVLNYLPVDTVVVTYNIPINMDEVIKELFEQKGVNGFISAGGDGSLNIILNALIKMNKKFPSNLFLGSIGLGSSNDFLKPHLNKIQDVPVKINWHKNQLTDIGEVQFLNFKGDLETRYFVINANMGVTAFANYSFNHPSKILAYFKMNCTNVAIIYAAMKGIFCYRNYVVDLLIDKTTSKQIMLSNLSVIKNRNISGKFRYAQKILINDGYLGLNYCIGMNKIELIATLFGLIKGKFKNNSKRKTHKITCLEVKSKSLVPLETDGEVFNSTEFSFKIIPKAIYTMGM